MTGASVATRSVWRRLYEGWLAIAIRFGEVQTLVILAVVYGLVIGPMALVIAAARRDLLHKRGHKVGLVATTEGQHVGNDMGSPSGGFLDTFQETQ